MIKKILTIIIVVLAVFLIYLGFKDNDVYYLSLGDSLAYGVTPYGGKDYGYAEYIKDYLNEGKRLEVFVDGLVNPNKRAIDIIKDIKENKEIMVNGKKKTFQNALIKADLVTLSIGINDFIKDLDIDYDFSINDLYNRFDQAIIDMEEMFKLLRDYCKEQIIMIGYYDPTSSDGLKEYFDYVNSKMATLASNYKIDYVNIYEIFENDVYFDNPKSFFPNKSGYEAIARKIIEKLP